MLKEERGEVELSVGESEAQHRTSLTPRLAWMICYKETGSAQEVCRKFGISRKTFYKWLNRYKASEGDTSSLEDQSRRPHHFPRATPESSVLLLKRLKEQTGFGQRRLRAYLKDKYDISISERTIWKILKRLESEEEKTAQSDARINESGDIVYSGSGR
jgi:transposase